MNQLVLIGGEERPINFGRNALGEYEKITGESLLDLELLQRIVSHVGFRAIAYSALKWGLYDPERGVEPSPKFTIFQVGDWLDEDQRNGNKALTKIMDVFREAMTVESKNVEAGGKLPA